MTLLDELESIYEKVVANPKNVDAKTKRRFWRLVGKIKRMSEPDELTILKAAEIRDLLYEHRLGKPKSLKLLVIWFILGAFCVYGYIWAIEFGPQYTGNLVHDILFVICIRVLTVLGAIAFIYPFGRLLGGKVTGIRLDGISRDIYYEPTLKVNYVSYLKAAPPKRKWFFFIAGIWTFITAMWVGTIGFLLRNDPVGLAIALLLLIFETLGALLGGKWAGEMGHFNRERRIVRDWKRNLAKTEIESSALMSQN